MAKCAGERIICHMPDDPRQRPPSRLRERLNELHEGQEEDSQQFLSVLAPLVGFRLVPVIVVGAIATLLIRTWLKPFLGGYEDIAATIVLIVVVSVLVWQHRTRDSR